MTTSNQVFEKIDNVVSVINKSLHSDLAKKYGNYDPTTLIKAVRTHRGISLDRYNSNGCTPWAYISSLTLEVFNYDSEEPSGKIDDFNDAMNCIRWNNFVGE